MGFEIIRFEKGVVIIKLNIYEYLLNVNGTFHSGVHATMIDYILGMAIGGSKTHVKITFYIHLTSMELYKKQT